MRIFRDLECIENSCLGLGFFDGVHIGHRVLIEELVSVAKNNNLNSAIVTFQKSPAESFKKSATYLNSTEEKEKLFSELGIDYVFELDFDTIMSLSAEEYLRDILIKYLHPKYILSGFNHTFGKNKAGTPKFLLENQQKYNYSYKVIPPVIKEAEVVSSTLIKSKLADGDIEKANCLLGYNFSIEGIVQKGRQLGRTIGFPTANITYPENKSRIPYGAYKATVEYNGEIYDGLLNYGIKPTINQNEKIPLAEVHIIGFNKDIYGDSIKISILKRIREERKFKSIEDLKNQIKEDMKSC